MGSRGPISTSLSRSCSWARSGRNRPAWVRRVSDTRRRTGLHWSEPSSAPCPPARWVRSTGRRSRRRSRSALLCGMNGQNASSHSECEPSDEPTPEQSMRKDITSNFVIETLDRLFSATTDVKRQPPMKRGLATDPTVPFGERVQNFFEKRHTIRSGRTPERQYAPKEFLLDRTM